MKDIDFDEIDRAVSSVNPNNADADNQFEPKVDNEPSTTELPNQTTATPKPALPLAGRRSTGQFMDVVHPSSNMRRAPVSAPSIRPLSPDKPAEPATEPPAEVPQPVETELPKPTIPNNGWGEPKAENNGNDIDKISQEISDELDHKTDELPDTPFISGTKVEKRPLGAFSTEPPAVEVESDTNSQSEQDVPANNGLPDELQDDIMSIESKESTPGPEPEKDLTKPVEKLEVVEKAAVPATEGKPTVVTPTSITQQYEEKPSTGDRDSGPIYDTNSYHKPLISPVKKKSGWKIIIWILGIIVIGVGAGVLVYFFVRPIL
jgi:hypothetical protein